MSYVVGYAVLFGVVLLPLYMMLAAWFGGKPRKFDTAMLGVGYIVGLTVVLLVATWVLGVVLGFFVPG